MIQPKVICLTAVRNDEWVIERFLKAASLWADYIIIADQNSEDKTREIASGFSKAMVINNDSNEYNELGRKRLLINEARKIKGDKLLITLDVDEMFSPEVFTSGEWDTILRVPKGTAINFQWSNFAADGIHLWKGFYAPWGYMDDEIEDYDSGISDTTIHCARIPITDNTPSYDVTSFSVIHYQYTDWDRMKHKHFYYQCLEVINNPGKSAIDIYRQYHHMDIIKSADLIKIPEEWVDFYRKKNIDILEVKQEKKYWYDNEVIKLFEKFGHAKFKKIDIWKHTWANDSNAVKYADPRSICDKIILYWLRYTQNKTNLKTVRRFDRLVKKLLKF